MTTLVFSNHSYWENDFIIYDLFPKNTRILFTNPTAFINPNYYIENNVEKGNCCLVFSTNEIIYQDMVNICTFLHPLIVVQLSDEDGWRNEYVPLASLTKLLIRQYYFQHYDYEKYTNILYIPLGYKNVGKDYFKDNYPIKLSTERKYDWSFIGDSNKHDRSQILYQLSLSSLKRYCIGNSISSRQMLDIYSESIFVPNCRGNVTMDCFRTYEASICGAIPLIVGDKHELNRTYFKEENPPWIFADNWDNAIKEGLYLINNPELLLEKQQNILLWWKRRIDSCNKTISRNLLRYSNFNLNVNEKIQIVIARYKEDITWTKNLSNVCICNKGLPLSDGIYGHQIINNIKNVGREGHTFYSYIYDNYNNLSEYTLFLQGNPFDHYPEILDKIQEVTKMEKPPSFSFFAIYISDIYLGYDIFYPDLNCHLNFKKAYEHIFQTIPSQECIMKRFPFGSGAQFIVSKSNILSRSRDFYKRIIDMLSYNSNPIEGHIIERFHKLVFQE